MNREKQVSVRFAAVGGSATKAEMRGIGLAGREAMQEINQSSSIAEGGLEQISAAALKARMDLEAMATKAMQQSMQIRTTIPAESALQSRVMQSTGITNATGMSAADTLRQGQALDDLRAKLNPLYNQIRQYKTAVSEARSAMLEGAISADEFAAAKARLRTSALAAIDGIKGITAANREAARAAEEAAMASMREAQALDDLRARYNPVYAATRQYRAALADLNLLKEKGKISSDEYSAALAREADRMQSNIQMHSVGMQQMSRASRGAQMRMQQMFYQVNDIGVSLAGGMNPFLVMAQQGTQIAQIYGFGNGGVGGIFRDLWKMFAGVVTRIPIVTAVLGTAGLAVAGLRHEINEGRKDTVSFGDTAKAVFQVIGSDIYQYIKPAVDMISEWFSWAWDKVVAGVVWVGNTVINAIKIAVDGVSTAVGTIPDIFTAAWSGAKAAVFYSLNDMVIAIESFLRDVAQGLNQTFGTSFAAPNMGGIATEMNKQGNDAIAAAQEAGRNINSAWDDFKKRTEETWNEDPMGGFFDRVAEQARENARTRADKDKKDSGSKSEKDEVADLVKELENQLAVLRETDPIKKKMLEYSDKLADATAEERSRVQGLVVELDKANHGYEAIGRSLAEYAEDSIRIGSKIGEAFVGGFKAAEDQFRQFVSGGKVSFKSLVQSMLADIATLQFRRTILGPLAGAFSQGGFFDDMLGAFFMHTGGEVGRGGSPAMVPAAVFAGAQRYHNGGWPGLKSDEVPIIAQKGERVLSREEVAMSRSAPRSEAMSITVVVEGAKGNQEIEQMVQQGVSAALKTYDREVLPTRVQSINKSPRIVSS